MARRAAAAKPRAEPNQQATNNDRDVAPWHPWCWHSVAEKCSSKRRCNKASDKCRAPGTISRLRVDKTSKNSADTRNPASECHEQDSGKPDQCTADRSRDWSEISHSLRHLHAASKKEYHSLTMKQI